MGESNTPVRRLIIELRRRRIFRTAALYIVGTWLVMQVSDVVFPALGIPDWAIRYVLIAALLGFPAAMVFGWFYDVGAHGIRRTGPAVPGEMDAAQSLGRSDYLILTALAGVAVVIFYGAFSNVADTPRTVYQAPGEGLPMVAVLPFISSSLGEDSEFFAVGIHDDLLTQLAHLQSIRVISRTSVMEYRNVVRNIREIGKELGADAILEGGVQRAGDRIRINAQLIDAKTDAHLWAKTYDRELSPANIFDVQAEIARAITSAMRTTLTAEDAEELETIPTENMAAYRSFRRAMDIADDPDAGFSTFAYRDALEETVALDPTFLRAMAELVGRQSYATFWEEDVVAAQRAAELLEQIRDLAPNSAEYLIARAYYSYYGLRDNQQALQFVEQAQEMRPNDAHLLNLKNWIQRRLGDFDGRLETVLLARKLDPREDDWTVTVVANLVTMHRYDEARREIANATFDNYMLSVLNSYLRVEEHGDLELLAEDVKSIQKEFGVGSDFRTLWNVLIASRDYEAALEVINVMPAAHSGRKNYLGEVPAKLTYGIITNALMQRNEPLSSLIDEARAILENAKGADASFVDYSVFMHEALLTAVEGRTEETELLIRRWRREAADDHTELTIAHDISCQILGLAGSASDAVECIRSGLVKPSSVIPFIEPLLPFYDSVRNAPDFVELLVELDLPVPAS